MFTITQSGEVYFSSSNTYRDVTIGAVNLSKAFIEVTARFLNSTSIRLQRYRSTGSESWAQYFIIESI